MNWRWRRVLWRAASSTWWRASSAWWRASSAFCLVGCFLGAVTRFLQFRDPLEQEVFAAFDQFADFGGDVIWPFGQPVFRLADARLGEQLVVDHAVFHGDQPALEARVGVHPAGEP